MLIILSLRFATHSFRDARQSLRLSFAPPVLCSSHIPSPPSPNLLFLHASILLDSRRNRVNRWRNRR